MNTLFGKIFIWFIVAQILISAALFAVSSATRTRLEPSNENWRTVVAEILISQSRAAAAAAENGESSPLRQFIVPRPEQEFPVAYFFVLRNNRLEQIDSTTKNESAEDDKVLRVMAAHALARGEVEWKNHKGRRLAAFATRTPMRRYVLVREFSRPVFVPFRDLRQPSFSSLLRSLTLLAVMVLVSYGLARYLAAPVKTLRGATHRLAEGDLSSRVVPKLGRRRDELSDLGHDFDRMAVRLEKLLASQSRLLGDISHELRSPLARLHVALDLIDDDDTLSPETANNLARIRREGERLNELIGQILILDRLENGQNGLAQRTNFAPVDLTPLLEEIAADAGFEARARNRDVHLTIEKPCRVSGDVTLLRSAIENVTRNAVLYSAENTTVEMALRSKEKSVVLAVQDRGAGVPEEALSDLFRPFYRVADARDRKSGGTGLGLAIAQRAVVLHGGTIEARNAEGGGLLVEIRLPCIA